MSQRVLSLGFALASITIAGAACGQTKTRVRSIDDLPQKSYPIRGSVSDILTAPPQSFAVAAAPIRSDIDHVLSAYDIADNATLRTLLQAKLGAEIASGKEDRAALATIAEIRAHEDKQEARLIGGLAPQAFLEARLASGASPGVCPHGFRALYESRLNALPWAVVGTAETRLKGLAEVASANFIIGLTAPDIQPTLDRTHALSSGPAWQLLSARVNMDVIVPCREDIIAATAAYIGAHAVQKSDIWAAREAKLPATGLSPVAVAIWDSGFDASLFPGQLLLSKDGRPVVAPAYDLDYRPTQGQLAPISKEDRAVYPQIVADTNVLIAKFI